MKHFTTEEWIDFVNQETPQKNQEAMRKHLGSGCKRCLEQVAMWQKVRNAAAAEANFQPPAGAVRMVKAAYASARLGSEQKEASSMIEVLFDSFLQPAVTGARSTATGIRQILYRADSYQIDIQIEAIPESNRRLVVTGQLMDVSTPETVGRGVQVTLSNRRGNLVHTVTNEFGEFRGEIDNSGDLELSVPGRGEHPVTLSLRNALGELPGGKA
jgi:hypothetical protein